MKAIGQGMKQKKDEHARNSKAWQETAGGCTLLSFYGDFHEGFCFVPHLYP